MPSPDKGKGARLRAIKEELHQVSGGDRLKLWLDYSHLLDEDPKRKGWMATCLPYLKLQSWSLDEPKHPRVVFSYTIQRSDCNMSGNAHGGHIATLFDFATTMPLTLVNKPGFWFYLGVSRTLSMTYLKPIPCGEDILIESEILSIGRRLCSVRGIMRRQSDGAVLASVDHGKYNNDPESSSNI